MTIVSGRNRVNRPYFFTQVDGSRAEFPSMGVGTADLEGRELSMFNLLVHAKQIEAVDVVLDEAPVNTAVPVISGEAKVGEKLTATSGEWTGVPEPTFIYIWMVDGVSATSDEDAANAYTPIADDIGKAITVKVVATNSAGSEESTSSATDPVAPADDGE